jgi:hypothetical protein
VLIKDPTKVQSVDPVTNEVTLKSNARGRMGTKIIVAPSLGDIDGDGRLNVVTGVNEAYLERPNAVFNNQLVQFLQFSGTLESGNGRFYALHPEGANRGAAPLQYGWNPDAFLPGWPVHVAMLTTEVLPVVGTGVNGSPALADLNKDGIPEIAGFSFFGPAYIFDGHGGSFLGEVRPGTPRTLEADVFGGESNAIDTPGYPSLGGGILAEMLGPGTGFQFIAPTTGLGKSLDTYLPAKQTPSQLHLSIWDVSTPDGQPTSGAFRTAFPRVVNDLQFFVSPSAADISGDDLAESLSGSGVYDLHAFSPDGTEPAGWPKFTGGWSVDTPSVGDIDGDGQREVASATREGYLFVWRTAGRECGYAPWRQYHHDEWSTGNYATDARPPAALHGALSARNDGGAQLLVADLPADNIYCGQAASLDVRYSRQTISTQAQFDVAERFTVSGVPAQGGRGRNTLLQLRPASALTGQVYVAARAADDAGNLSTLSDLGAVTLVIAPTPTPSSTRSSTPTATRTTPPTATSTPSTIPSATAVPKATATSVPLVTATIAPRLENDGVCAIVAPRQSSPFAKSLLAVGLALAALRRRARSR